MPKTQLDHEENTFWPWVLGLVVLALVVWVAAEVSGESDAAAPEPTVVTVPATRTTGEALLTWVRDSAEMQERADGGGSYAGAGMVRVVAALRTLVAGDSALDARLNGIAAETTALDSMTSQTERVVALRNIFLESAAVLEAHPASAGREAVQRLIGEARAAAETLDTEVSLEEQRHRIFSFFDHIAEAIRLAGEPVTG